MIHLNRAQIVCPDKSFKKRLAKLKENLQTAIELEHSTIPPYLYALYSIKTAANLEIASLIKSIVLQEMLHMAIDCNVLNAIDGQPKLDDPAFIPSYPGNLPGSVESSLIVGLAPLSKQLIHDVFMVIEEPEQTVDGTKPPPDGMTIGEFYQHLQSEIRELSKKHNLFTGNPARQLRTGFVELQDMNVHDADTAIAALQMIIDQGEGTADSPLDAPDELAHYYKYAEIYHGKKLIANPAPKPGEPAWVFAGHRIAFNPAGVQPVIVNPNAGTYAGKPRLQDLNYSFNQTYSNMLRMLEQVFNGQPDYLGPAMLSMQNLKQQAQLLMAQEIVPGQTAGPTFDYVAA
ncbi:MAG: hypothetical protein RL748_450 [Pseudomonadota bacterium]